MSELRKKIELAIVDIGPMEEATQQFLIDRFIPFFEQAIEWKEKAESLVVTDINQTREMKMAREARLALREIRINADKNRKALKEDSLRYGRAVQGVYNVIEAVISPIENHLEKQEKFKEIYEMNHREALRLEREQLAKDVREYMISNINLGEITEEDFQRLWSGAKLQKQAAEEAERKAEEDRQERLKAEAEERERLRVENERLRAEAVRIAAEKKAELDKLEAEMKAAKEKAAQERAEAEKQAAAARAEAARIAAELRAKEEAEARAEAERQAAIEAELSKGDNLKFQDFKDDLLKIKNKYIFKSKKYKNIQNECIILINKILIHITAKENF